MASSPCCGHRVRPPRRAANLPAHNVLRRYGVTLTLTEAMRVGWVFLRVLSFCQASTV